MNATVIIPTYTRSARLRALLSCLAQQEGDSLLQVIVCDDGSTDDTREVVASFAGQLPLEYRFQEDRGFRAGQARNLGIADARGEVIIFLDDDVVVPTDFVSAHLEAHRLADPAAAPAVVLGFRHRSHHVTMLPPRLEDIVQAEPDDRIALIGPDGSGIASHPTPWMFVYSCNFSARRGTAELLFDEAFVGWGLEDIDLGYRLVRAGVGVTVAHRARVLHLEDPAPRDPFRCEERSLPPTYDSYVRNAVQFMDKHSDPTVEAWVRNDLRWYVRDEARGAWVKNGYENDVEAVIQACRAERKANVNKERPEGLRSVAKRSLAIFEPIVPRSAMTHALDELAVELTVYCNLQCKMCSVWELREHGVPFELAKQLLRDARELGAHMFTPCGAESFMRKDFLDLVEYAQELGYRTQDIVTNGTMITAAHLDRLERCPSVYLHISIDGPEEIHDDLRGEGNYQKSVECARECVRRGIRVGLSSVLMRETIQRVHHIVDLAAELGIGEVSFQPFQEEISGAEKDIPRFSLLRTKKEVLAKQLDTLSAYAKERGVTIFTESMFGVIPDYLSTGKRPIPPGGCFLPSKFLLVDFRGDIYPCFFMRSDEDRMGNVYKDAIPDIWHGSHHNALQVLALGEQCPGCLAACSDVDSFVGKEAEPVVYAAPKGHALAGSGAGGT